MTRMPLKRMFKKILVSMTLAVVGSANCGFSDPPAKLIETTYIIQQEDTLIKISSQLIGLNSYGPREIYEFMSGIREINPWLQEQEYHQDDILLEGKILRINYWIKGDS